jgi:hypothetical protein
MLNYQRVHHFDHCFARILHQNGDLRIQDVRDVFLETSPMFGAGYHSSPASIEMYGTCMEINDKSMEIDETCSKRETIHIGNE